MIAVFAAAATLAAAPASVSDIKPIPVRPGVNVVPGFAPGGGAAQIVRAWRGNGNAHGYNVFLLLTSASEGRPLSVADVASGAPPPGQDIIRDDPFDGERVLGVVRFARAKVNGSKASLLIVAHLDDTPNGVLADHDKATVRIFRLVRDDSVGATSDAFQPVAVIHTDKTYCNAELALRDSLGIPLSQDFAGPNRTDGCFGGP